MSASAPDRPASLTARSGSDDPTDKNATYLIRTHQPADLDWIVQAHSRLYAQEYDWDTSFETLVVEITRKFAEQFDPERERCWIAEVDGRNVGSVLLVRESNQVAKLRLLIIEPRARGLGLGKELVSRCIEFATDKQYQTLTLWTNDILISARQIYQQFGFVLTDEAPHHSFGHDLIGQHWQLTLPSYRGPEQSK